MINPSLLTFVLLPIITGLIIYVFHIKFKMLPLIIEVILLSLLVLCRISIASDQSVQTALSFSPLPYGMMLRMDQLSFLMTLLNTIIYTTCLLYDHQKTHMNPLFMFLFLSLQGLINGVFLATDFFNVYILLEVATVTVSILIMFKKDSRSMYDGMMYLMINIFAMAFFLMGIGYLYRNFGVFDFTSLKHLFATQSDLKPLILPFSFLFTGISLKAAIMPLFSWLPKAHATASSPSIVSAVLSGIFVKTGIYLMIRLQEIFYLIDISTFLGIVGFLTVIVGFIFAISQTDIKLILAYHTVSQIGFILIGMSGYNEVNFAGSLYHIFSHGIFKSTLFIIAGYLIDLYGTRKLEDMSGLWHHSKIMTISLLIAILAITGAPFFSGGFSKYFIAYGYDHPLSKFLFSFMSGGTMLSFMKFTPLFKKSNTAEHAPMVSNKKITKTMTIALIVLSTFSVGLGIFGNTLMPIITGISVHLTLLDMIKKIPQYILVFTICTFLYRFKFHKLHLFKSIKTVELGFNSVVLAVIGYFFVTLIVLSHMTA